MLPLQCLAGSLLLYSCGLEGLGLLLVFVSVCPYSTKSASTNYSAAVVVFGREPMLPMEHDVWVITDG